MGKRLAESLPAARRLYDRAADVLGYDLAKLCFEGPADDLDSTVYSQPAIFVTSLAALESLRAESPDVVLSCEATAGLSLGEYTAMVFAGVMEFEDGLMLVQRRGAAMQEAADATPSGMVSILGLERVEVEALCEKARNGEILKIANLLCPAQHRDFRQSGGLRAGGRDGPVVRRDEGHAAGRGRGVSYRNHAAGRPALRRGPGRRAHAKAANSRDFQRRRPAARRSRGNPPDPRPPDPPAGALGRLDALPDCSRDSTSSTRSGPAACFAGCCGGSIATCRASAWKCEGELSVYQLSVVSR